MDEKKTSNNLTPVNKEIQSNSNINDNQISNINKKTLLQHQQSSTSSSCVGSSIGAVATSSNNNNNINIPNVPSVNSLSSLSSINRCNTDICNHFTSNDNEHETDSTSSNHSYSVFNRCNITPSPKINNNNNLNSNNNQNTPLSPHITALTRLYTHDNTNNTNPTPSPTDNDNNDNDNKISILSNNSTTNAQKSIKTRKKSVSSYIWSTVNHYIPNINGNNNDDNDEKGLLKQQSNVNHINDIMTNPNVINNAFEIYTTLDKTLKDIEKRKNQLKQNNENNKNNLDKEVIGIMRTLISSTSMMGNWFNNNNNDNSNNNDGSNIINSTLSRLSSSISYMSWISIGKVTPYIYNMVEICLVELYSTIKDVIEYYDPDPKSNILLQIINKMNEIIAAIRGLLALSDCFYERTSDDDSDNDNSNNNNNTSSYSYMHHFNKSKKHKKD